MTVPPAFDATATIHDLASLGMRVSQAVARLAEIETEVAEAVAAELARAFDRVSRAVRRSVALAKRLEARWPVRAAGDMRAATVRRQVSQGVAAAIRQAATGEAAEWLFDDLAEQLDDPALDAEIATVPVEAIVARIRRDLG